MILPAVVLFSGLVFLPGCPMVDNPAINQGESITEGEAASEGESVTEGEIGLLDDGSAVAALEREAFDLVNAERIAQGLEALRMDDALRAVARAHSADMVARGFFDHVNPDGLNPFDRLANAGVLFSAAAENIASNSGFSNPAEAAVNSWMNSTGHRTNILNGVYTHTGMGAAYDSNAGAYYFTQVFIKPR